MRIQYVWPSVVVSVMATVIGFAATPQALAEPVVRPIVSAAGSAFCGLGWGSLTKVAAAPGAEYWFSAPTDGSAVDGVRAGRHACYDRLVVDVLGSRSGYRVQYVDAVREFSVVPGERGDPVRLAGAAFLEIVVPTNAGLPDGTNAFLPADRGHLVDVTGFRTLRQVAEVGWYEAARQIGVGVRGRLPFRVFTLSGPGDHSRLVVDVAHRW